MSGFVCILHGDNAPIERALLQSLTDFLSFRGPDGQRIWMDGPMGMGHALLQTTFESKNEQQPLGLEERYWIVADARLDRRAELIAELRHKEHVAHQDSPDCELVLGAYAAWGEACVDHLGGDFSFVIWDKQRKKLFCARDHFGVKPFYYASVGSLVVLSNTLNCIRRHPAVAGRLNDLAIADFLLFDMIREPGATSFADIRRLQPAHTLVHEGSGISVRRYWTLPVSEPLSCTKPYECVEQFKELLDRAVSDRVRANHVGVLMSGGLDSSTVAASARRALGCNGGPAGLRAYTDVFQSLIPHEERHYAQLVADALKIPIQFQTSDGFALWEQANHNSQRWPEPAHFPWSDTGRSQVREVMPRNRVALTGFGGDPALSCLLSAHFLRLIKKGQLGRALADAARYLTAQGRFSRLYVRTRWRRWFASKSRLPSYPPWFNRDLERRLGLRERWEALSNGQGSKEAARAVAYLAITDPMWPNLFEGYDGGVTGVPVEVRHPFFDLRLVNFFLALPALPWCSDKELLREAARGVLPDAVRLRRKSPLLADPLIALLQQKESAWVDSFVPVPQLSRYVERESIPKVLGERDPWTAWIHLRPVSLNFWLRLEVASGINLSGAA